ncbi:MAG: hypothetical protein IPJ41_16355 [Phycisphaerales bacterium]|nr:hypothetical protein [Phycisphaerales bacterium]
MSLRLDSAEPADMTPDDRIDEIAIIVARGILRLQGRHRVAIASPQNLEESLATCLELVAPLPLDGVAG